MPAPRVRHVTAPLRIAVRPERSPDWVTAAVVAGGAELHSDPRGAEAVVWTDSRDPEGLRAALAQAPSVRWVQLLWAGVEDFVAPGLIDDTRIWTCSKGACAAEVAEHALALALAGLRDLHIRVDTKSWGAQSGRSLLRGRVTILGAGGVAQALLRLVEPLQVRTTVVRRSSNLHVHGATRTLGVDRLQAALSDADLVVLALALTPETRGIIDASALHVMPDHCWLVNVARGAHVLTPDLLVALRDGWIAGAALDVTDPEPLPVGHPLWSVPNCIITPHTANTVEMARPRTAERITQNVRRWIAGQPLIGLIDARAGY